MDDVKIYPGKKRLILIAGLSVGMALLVYGTPREWLERFSISRGELLALGIPFFSFCALYCAFRLWAPKPSVVLNDEGLFDNASATGAGMLRWEEIAQVYAYTFAGQTVIGIVPVDENRVTARMPMLKRLLLDVNRGTGAAPFNIPLATLPVTADELLASIETRMESHRRRTIDVPALA